MPNSFSGIGGWNVVDSELRSLSSEFATTAIFSGSDAGLVPSALPSDSAKALRGDGTWGDVSNVNVIYDTNLEELHLDFSIGGN